MRQPLPQAPSHARCIYVDFDDVLCETASALTGLLAREFGKQVAFADIFSFNLADSFGLPPADLEHLMEVAHQPEALLGMQPLPGAVETLNRWATDGYAIEVVTGRPPATRATSEEWLRRHGVPCTALTFLDKYNRHGDAPGDRSLTLDEFRTRRYALAVDDAPRMIAFLADDMQMPVAVMARPWNVVIPGNGPRPLPRFPDWEAIRSAFPAP